MKFLAGVLTLLSYILRIAGVLAIPVSAASELGGSGLAGAGAGLGLLVGCALAAVICRGISEGISREIAQREIADATQLQQSNNEDHYVAFEEQARINNIRVQSVRHEVNYPQERQPNPSLTAQYNDLLDQLPPERHEAIEKEIIDNNFRDPITLEYINDPVFLNNNPQYICDSTTVPLLNGKCPFESDTSITNMTPYPELREQLGEFILHLENERKRSEVQIEIHTQDHESARHSSAEEEKSVPNSPRLINNSVSQPPSKEQLAASRLLWWNQRQKPQAHTSQQRLPQNEMDTSRLSGRLG